jgi:EAL domain-containing protein (putative c-di-GMP-specific phosphodiesterase class I)
MHQVKEGGRNGYQFFSPAVHEKARHRREIETGLRAAVASARSDRCEFQLHYQPIIHVPSNRVTAVEALVRWTPGGKGMISPGEFIPVAEDTGLIVPLGQWVMAAACAQACSLSREGHRVHMAVNVAARQFREPGFVRSVESVLNAMGIAPSQMELEITERTVMEDITSGSHVLGELKQLGVRIALDDFGTGYSSLSYLTRLPIDVLKIDRSFVKDLGTRNRTETVTAAIIALARGLGIDIVAEGVETEEQLAFLRAHGPVDIQGFLFARPMPAPALAVWLAERERARAAHDVPQVA